MNLFTWRVRLVVRLEEVMCGPGMLSKLSHIGVPALVNLGACVHTEGGCPCLC